MDSCKHEVTGGKPEATDGKRKATGDKHEATGGKPGTTDVKHETTDGKRKATGDKPGTTGGRQLKDDCVNWIRDWFDRNGRGCCAVIGMSGGKDSTVAAALCAEALGPDRVVGVAMPAEGQSLNDADKICARLGIRYVCAPIGSILQAFGSAAEHSGETVPEGESGAASEHAGNTTPDGESGTAPELSSGTASEHSGGTTSEHPGGTASEHPGGTRLEFSSQTIQNIPPRVRMTMLYAIAQSVNGMVANTCNLSEDYIGYATLYGDAAGSFSPLRKLCVREVRAIGHELGLPAEWVDKTPDDGLPNSRPDEEKFGFSYETLDRYIREGICEDEATRRKIDTMHQRNLFKTEILNIPAFEPKTLKK